MVTRLLLSLKKASTTFREGAWSFGEPAANTAMVFAERRGGVTTKDGINLDTFLSTDMEGRSRA